MVKKTMAKKLIMALILLWPVPSVSDQNPDPYIVSFSADLASITVSEVEAGNTRVTLSWRLANTESMPWWVTVEFYCTDGWMVLYEGNDEEFGTVLEHPGNFAPPTFRLSLHACYGCPGGGNGRAVIDEWILTIPYRESGDTQTPEIETFTASTKSWCVACNPESPDLISLSWKILHRIPTSNLAFDILSPDTVDATSPYGFWNPWIPSEGQGSFETAVWWEHHRGESVIRFRLHLIDVISGEIYDEAELTIPIVAGSTSAPDAPVPTLAGTLAPG